MFRKILAVSALLAVPLAAPADAQTTLKIAHFVTPKHSVSQWIEKWAAKLEKDSNGKLKFQIFPGAQLGPPPKYYELVRTGQADITWFGHGFTPGRFPLTEISNLPYMVGSAEIGTKMLNDPALRRYLAPEHKGVKILLLTTHQPGNINMAKTPVKTIADLKSKRIRFASVTIKDFIAALGGTPVGMPPTQIAESMQKGTLDGAFIDYGGAGIAFKLGPVTKYTTEMYSYVTSFCICMNQRSYDKLSPDLKKLIDQSTVGVEKTVGQQWDKLDDIGKSIMVKSGTTPIKLTKAEDDKFRAIGKKVSDKKIAELDKKGLPARKVYDLMNELSAKYAKNSRNFWTQ